jgi:hypothetical protein
MWFCNKSEKEFHNNGPFVLPFRFFLVFNENKNNDK